MREDVYGTVERVFTLLSLLNNAPGEGLTRAEIFQAIPTYVDSSKLASRAGDRMLERDLEFLVSIGFHLEKPTRYPVTRYRIVLAENYFKRSKA